jgi:hypothetical protein
MRLRAARPRCRAGKRQDASRLRVQGFLKLHGDIAVALPTRAVPSSVRLRAVDLVLALKPHATFLDQPCHVTDVDL